MTAYMPEDHSSMEHLGEQITIPEITIEVRIRRTTGINTVSHSQSLSEC